MTEEKQKIIDEVLKNFKYNDHFEKEHFIYWVKEEYFYNGDSMTRDEFKEIQNYVITHGTVPCATITKQIESTEEWIRKDIRENNDNIYGYHNQMVLRYSKTYDSLEMYEFNTNIKSPYASSSRRIMVFSKKTKIFKVNTKNYVLINGNKWLSLKNWEGFGNRGSLQKPLIHLLMSTMLGGKDWILNLEETKGYMIQNKNARKAKSLEESVEFECGAKPAKRLAEIFNKSEIISIYSLINPNKIHDLTNFLKKNKLAIETLLKDSCNDNAMLFLYYYFLCKDNRTERHTMMDYLRMLQEEGEKLNLDMSSYVTLKTKHDDLSRRILVKSQKKKKKGRISVSKIYPEIESLPEMKVEQIRSAKRLDEESVILHHCVHDYKHQINKGECSIYSLFYNDQRYTLQISATKQRAPNGHTSFIQTDEGEEFSSFSNNGEEVEFYEFRMTQLKGKYNCDAPESMRKYIDLMCKNNEILPLEKSGVRLRPNEVEKKESKQEVQVAVPVRQKVPKVVQIGDKILDGLVDKKSKDKMAVGDLPF